MKKILTHLKCFFRYSSEFRKTHPGKTELRPKAYNNERMIQEKIVVVFAVGTRTVILIINFCFSNSSRRSLS